MSGMPEEFLAMLGQNPCAATRFAGLDEGEKEAILDSVRRAGTVRERENIVSRI